MTGLLYDKKWTSSNPDKAGFAKMGQDWNTTFASPTGTEIDTPVGKYVSKGNGVGDFTDLFGQTTEWKSSQSPDEIAAMVPSTGKFWEEQYGFIPTPIAQAQKTTAEPVYRQVEPGKETIEGRLSGLLSSNSPVIRQAVDRANAQFSQRGLLNSSMAVQAGNEAAIAKAIEIAGPDAQTYAAQGKANQEASNTFNLSALQQKYDLEHMDMDYALKGSQAAVEHGYNMEELEKQSGLNLRSNYLQDMGNITAGLNAQITDIQIQNMTPEEKTSAVNVAQDLANNRIEMLSDIYQNMPGFSQEWMTTLRYGSTAENG